MKESKRKKEDGTIYSLIFKICLSERRCPIYDNVGEEKRSLVADNISENHIAFFSETFF